MSKFLSLSLLNLIKIFAFSILMFFNLKLSENISIKLNFTNAFFANNNVSEEKLVDSDTIKL